jgi:hypothetical protein
MGDSGRSGPKTSQNDPLDRLIAAIAFRQRGNITAAQLASLGLDGPAITRRVRSGRLFRVFHGVYSVGRPPSSPLDSAAAAVLACGPGAALSHSSAMVLWGFWKRWETPYEVSVPGDRRPKGIRVHRTCSLVWPDYTVQLGIHCTSPARTLLDIAHRLGDEQLARAVNDARLSLFLQPSHLPELLERWPRHRSASRLRPWAETDQNPTRSEQEDNFPAYCKRHGLPQPQMDVFLAGCERDAVFAPQKVIVELDSWKFHSGRLAFETDRERDAQAAAAGYQVVRITRKRLTADPRRGAELLRDILRCRS